jgi:ABC-2 type transport system permease protein
MLFRGALRDVLRPRRLLGAAPLIVMPGLLGLLWHTAKANEAFNAVQAYDTLSGGMVFGFVLVILSVIFGTGVVSQEVEQRTLVYLLTRPVPRWRILLAKFAGALVGITAASWLSTLLLALSIFGGGMFRELVGRDLLILPIGALAYGSFFLLLAAAFNRPLIIGLGFAFGWETWAPMLSGVFQRFSLMTYLRVLAPHESLRGDDDIFQILSQVLNPDKISQATAWWTLTIAVIVALGTSVLVFSKREYAPRDDAE